MFSYLLKEENWGKTLLVVLGVSFVGVALIGYGTYQHAPPIPTFESPSGETVVSRELILKGQRHFKKYGLMDYGSFFGDGALKGPDFTADALHQTTLAMIEYYDREAPEALEGSPYKEDAIRKRVQKEIKDYRFSPEKNTVRLSPGQTYAFGKLVDHYEQFFRNPDENPGFFQSGIIDERKEIRALSAFFFWAGWVSGVQRPGRSYSFTHNWPYDPLAGNTPTSPIMIWSVLGTLGLIVGLGLVLYIYGQMERLNEAGVTGTEEPILTSEQLRNFSPSPTQKATFKFFLVAVFLFLIQVLAGFLTIDKFIHFMEYFGLQSFSDIFPITVTRSWHIQLSLFWISACWIGGSFFALPLISKEEPDGQVLLINLTFWLTVIMVAGSFVGIFLGPKDLLGSYWSLFGHQGWEFMEQGKFWQGMLFIVFLLWAVIVVRGLKPVLKKVDIWALPNWLMYTVGSIVALMVSGFVMAGSETNFVIADFWRWAVIHMWVEAFFEVFTTVLVGYFMVLMGLVTLQATKRAVYLATLLFLGSGLLGISHNFYWNAKPEATLALGSIFSTLQVVPLILLTLEAWRFVKMPEKAETDLKTENSTIEFACYDVFLFLLAVNFWNFFGAGVLGFIINLPIVNYFEHATYLTVNHGHAALFGVYGNLAIAAILFCCKHLFSSEVWNRGLIRCSFWSLNIGLMLMVVFDLFPVGVLQLKTVLNNGLWYARSHEFVMGPAFTTFTWLRGIGVMMFFLGGVLPLCWFLLSRAGTLRSSRSIREDESQYVPDRPRAAHARQS